jgi:hypothetical protein
MFTPELAIFFSVIIRCVATLATQKDVDIKTTKLYRMFNKVYYNKRSLRLSFDSKD